MKKKYFEILKNDEGKTVKQIYIKLNQAWLP